MAFDTYANLQAEVSAYLQKGASCDARIPSWITLAEADIAKDLRTWRMESLETLTVTGATATVALPTRLRDIKWLKLNGTEERILEHLPAAAFYGIYAQATSDTPRHYTLSEGNLLLGPTPSENGTLSALCILAPSPLSVSNTSNSVLTNYPEIYFYGTLVHGFRFLRNQERMREALDAYAVAIGKANLESNRRKSLGTSAGVRGIGRRSVV